MAKTFKTAGDYRRAKILAEKHEAPALKPTDPRIGQLMRKGKPVYYATINGEHIEGEPEYLTAKLDGAV